MTGDGLKLDLACGQSKREGYIGVDHVKTGDVDEVVDLLHLPFPWEPDSVAAVHCSHFVEHIPHTLPLYGKGDGYAKQYAHREGFFAWFDELYRVCRHDAEVEVIHPYAMSTRAFQDPTHHRFIPEATWYYLNREWRTGNLLDHYDVSCDFDVVGINGLGVNTEIQMRSHEAQAYARTHYWHVIQDLHVTLRVRKA